MLAQRGEHSGRGVRAESDFFLRQTTFLTPEHHIWQDSKVDPASKAQKTEKLAALAQLAQYRRRRSRVQGFAVNSDITRLYDIGPAERAPRVFRFFGL